MFRLHNDPTAFEQKIYEIKAMIAASFGVEADDIHYNVNDVVFAVDVESTRLDRVVTLVDQMPCDVMQVYIAPSGYTKFTVTFHCKEGDIPSW